MTQDEIIRMAREAGMKIYKGGTVKVGDGVVKTKSVISTDLNELERFAALATIRAARAQEQAEQEPLMDYERINALREGEQNGAEDAYFFVRPENDTPTLRKMFCQGFERGFHKGLKYAAQVSAEAIRAEAIDEVVKFISESGLIAPTGLFAAAIRGLK